MSEVMRHRLTIEHMIRAALLKLPKSLGKSCEIQAKVKELYPEIVERRGWQNSIVGKLSRSFCKVKMVRVKLDERRLCAIWGLYDTTSDCDSNEEEIEVEVEDEENFEAEELSSETLSLHECSSSSPSRKRQRETALVEEVLAASSDFDLSATFEPEQAVATESPTVLSSVSSDPLPDYIPLPKSTLNVDAPKSNTATDEVPPSPSSSSSSSQPIRAQWVMPITAIRNNNFLDRHVPSTSKPRKAATISIPSPSSVTSAISSEVIGFPKLISNPNMTPAARSEHRIFMHIAWPEINRSDDIEREILSFLGRLNISSKNARSITIQTAVDARRDPYIQVLVSFYDIRDAPHFIQLFSENWVTEWRRVSSVYFDFLRNSACESSRFRAIREEDDHDLFTIKVNVSGKIDKAQISAITEQLARFGEHYRFTPQTVFVDAAKVSIRVSYFDTRSALAAFNNFRAPTDIDGHITFSDDESRNRDFRKIVAPTRYFRADANYRSISSSSFSATAVPTISTDSQLGPLIDSDLLTDMSNVYLQRRQFPAVFSTAAAPVIAGNSQLLDSLVLLSTTLNALSLPEDFAGILDAYRQQQQRSMDMMIKNKDVEKQVKRWLRDSNRAAIAKASSTQT